MPLCFPHFQPGALLHAYIACLDAPSSLFLLLLGGSPDSFLSSLTKHFSCIGILITVLHALPPMSFPRRHGETFVPLCLPHFQPGALLHAYIACLDAPSSLFLLLLGGSPDSFHALAAQRVLLEAELLQQGVALRVADISRGGAGGRPTVEQLPPPAGEV